MSMESLIDPYKNRPHPRGNQVARLCGDLGDACRAPAFLELRVRRFTALTRTVRSQRGRSGRIGFDREVSGARTAAAMHPAARPSGPRIPASSQFFNPSGGIQ